MIGPAVIEEIQRLLAEGNLSRRKIAKVMRVSRGTVAAVASGRRLPRDLPPPPKRQFKLPRGPVRRCPECGGMVMLPCLACRIRKLNSRLPDRYPAATRDEPLRMELADKARARYEEIRQRKILADG